MTQAHHSLGNPHLGARAGGISRVERPMAGSKALAGNMIGHPGDIAKPSILDSINRMSAAVTPQRTVGRRADLLAG